MIKRSTAVGILCGFLGVAAAHPALGQVKVWEGTLTLPTYDEGPPDPNPPFDTYATTEFNYPYTMRTALTGTKSNHAWRALFLENEYLKCTILPDLGGHLYTCIDKRNGHSMFYANTAIKKAEIGHRGAWAAFGVEFNFPVSHNWASLSPVDFARRMNPDGSATVIVGNIDRPYGMQWNVELTLRPRSTVLAEHVTLFNRSDVRHRFYWWDNAGVRVWDDSRLQYPMSFVASHYFTDIYTWPEVTPGGKDLTVIRNHTDGPVSYFAHGTHETFMGVWNPHTNAGVAQYSQYQDLPAKKIWSWGADAAGLAWRDALSDDHSAYVEVQAGLFRNQETYSFLDPGQTIQFDEVWMPVSGTGGISRANPAGVVFLKSDAAQVTVRLNVNEPVPGAHLELLQADKPIWGGTANLSPDKIWSQTARIDPQGSRVTFLLQDAAGNTLLKQTEGSYDLDPIGSIQTGPQQSFAPPPPSKRTEDQWLETGHEQELNGQLLQAMSSYSSALQKYGESVPLKTAAGRLAASLQRYPEAVSLLRDVQQRDTSNQAVAYYLGLAEKNLGHEREAETALDIAYRQASYRAPAALLLASLHARAGNLQHALQLARTAAATEPLNFEAREQAEALLRATGDIPAADRLAEQVLAMDPTNGFVKNDMGKPDLPHLAADPYRVLRLAAEYMQLGLYRSALDVLSRRYLAVPADQSEPGSVLPQSHPLVRYYAAFCQAQLHLDNTGTWREASQLSPALVFPSTETDHEVLQAALTVDPNDGTAHYLRGTLLFSKGLYDAGMADWTEALRLSPELRVADADLGRAWLGVKHDPKRASAYFLHGLQHDRLNPAIYVGLDETLSLNGAPASERARLLSRYPGADAANSTIHPDLTYELALTRAEAGQFTQAEGLFHNRFFASEEGGITSNQVLFEVELMQAEHEASAHGCKSANAMLKGDLARLTENGASSLGFFRMAGIAGRCGLPELRKTLLEKAAQGNGFAERVWAYKAAEALGAPDAATKEAGLKMALPPPASLDDPGAYTSYHWYGIGLLQAELGESDASAHSFRTALSLPDEWMAHHLAREALQRLGSTR